MTLTKTITPTTPKTVIVFWFMPYFSTAVNH